MVGGTSNALGLGQAVAGMQPGLFTLSFLINFRVSFVNVITCGDICTRKIISVLSEVNTLLLHTVARFVACRNGLSAVALDVI